MAIPARTALEGTFFVTTITYGRRRLFQVPANAEVLLDTIQHYRAQGAYKLHAFVIMPDHVHLLLTTCAKTLPQTMNLIKGGFSRRHASAFPIWQRSYADHLVRNAEDFAVRLQYIADNPVRARLASTPALYPYSSAFRIVDASQR